MNRIRKGRGAPPPGGMAFDVEKGILTCPVSDYQELAPWAGVKFVMLLIFPNLQRSFPQHSQTNASRERSRHRERALQCEGFSF